MSTSELRTIIERLKLVRDNAKLPDYLDTEQAQAIRLLSELLERLNKGELTITKGSK